MKIGNVSEKRLITLQSIPSYSKDKKRPCKCTGTDIKLLTDILYELNQQMVYTRLIRMEPVVNTTKKDMENVRAKKLLTRKSRWKGWTKSKP